MSTQAIQAGEAFVALNVNQDQFNKSLIDISSKLDDLGKRTKSLTNLMNGAFNGAAKSLKPLGDVISLSGVSIDIVGTTLLSFCSNLQKATYCGELLTFSQLKNQVATNLSRVALEKNIVVQYGLAAASYVAAAGMKVLGVAQSILNFAMLGCPLTWFLGGILAIGGAVSGVMYLFGGFTDKTAESAKAMEELCKRNDAYRESAKKCLDTLEEFGNKTSLSSEQLNASKSAWNDLERTTQQLGINLQDLGITFDNGKGKINASAEAMKALKKEMRAKELEELNKTIQAQGEYIDDLNIKLKNAKTWSWRSFGTYVTFGYVDNAEEIQKQIDEESQKFQETQDKRKTIIDFSAEYKENEAKLKEIYDKDAEAFKNALAIKIDNIKTEFSEREAILKQLMHEAEVRDSLSFEDMEKLREHRAALAGLNAEQERRIQLLRDEQAEKYPLQDVTAWLGNSPAVAQKHYLQVKSTNFQLASETETVGHFIGHKKGQHCNAEACRNMNENEEVPCFTTPNALLNINLHESAHPTESPSSVVSAS